MQLLQVSNCGVVTSWQVLLALLQNAYWRHLSPSWWTAVQAWGGFGPHWRSRPWQLVNSQTGDNVGAGVVSATGVSPVGVAGGTAPPGGEDTQPVTRRASIAMHITGMINEVFIRLYPLLTTTDTRDNIYGFIWSSLNFLLLPAIFFRDLFYPKGDGEEQKNPQKNSESFHNSCQNLFLEEDLINFPVRYYEQQTTSNLENQ